MRYLALALLLLVAGCKTNVTVEVYSSDLQATISNGEKLPVATLMEIQIPSADECEKYSGRIAEIMKGLVKNFNPRECKRKEMEAFLLADVQSPLLVGNEAWKAADSLFGVVVSSDKKRVFVALNLEKFATLNSRMRSEFHQTLKLDESKVTMILHNDERTPMTVGLGGAMVDGKPLYQRRDVEIKRRGKATIELSNVGSAALAKEGQVMVLGLKS